MSNCQFGRPHLKSFVNFKTSFGRPSKATLLGKAKKIKIEEEDPGKEVIISIGLKVWDEDEEELKEKKRKRLPLKVPQNATCAILLEKAKEKWQNFRNDLYDPESEYGLVLEDNQDAQFIPGTGKKVFFSLNMYKDALITDYKRMTIYLCKQEDINLNEDRKAHGCSVDHHDHSPDTFEMGGESEEKAPEPPKSTPTTYASPGSGSSFLEEELNRMYGDGGILDNENRNDGFETGTDSSIENGTDIRDALKKKVIDNEKQSMFIVVRRGAPLSRMLCLWQRAAKKVSAQHVIRVKFLGEEGIDTGALARTLFTSTVDDIAKNYFPEGNPIFSTNDIHNGNYKVIGEIAAASLAQGGPAPGFFAPCVFDSLVNSDVDFTADTSELEKNLTESELQVVNGIRQGELTANNDIILEHGYTGPITRNCVESIIGAVVVSMLSRRLLVLKEFSKGLGLYGLADIVSKYPAAARSLFVMGKQKPVDADYLLSVLKPQYSPNQSSRRSKEENIMDHFQDFIVSLEDEKIVGYSEALDWKTEVDEQSLGTNENDEQEERYSVQSVFIGII